MKRETNTGEVFGYDLNDQVTATLQNVASPDTTPVGSQTINYDANGNRTTFSAYGPTDTYTTNNLNQYSARNSTQATYDTKGNLTAFSPSTYTYDAQNRLISATNGSSTASFAYDGLNRQISRTINGTRRFQVWDGWNLIQEFDSFWYYCGLGCWTLGRTNTAAYVHGPTGLIKEAMTNRYYYQDGSGSTSHLASSSGQLLEWYRYDLQGTPVFYNSTNQPLTSSTFGIRHLFTGQQWYSELGLYDLRNRFYSPDLGRFLQSDPIGFAGGDVNLYRYVGNNPVTRTDPSGLGWWIGEKIYQWIGGNEPSANVERQWVIGNPTGENATTAGPGYQGPATPLDYSGGAPGEGSSREGGGGSGGGASPSPSSPTPTPTPPSPSQPTSEELKKEAQFLILLGAGVIFLGAGIATFPGGQVAGVIVGFVGLGIGGYGVGKWFAAEDAAEHGY